IESTFDTEDEPGTKLVVVTQLSAANEATVAVLGERFGSGNFSRLSPCSISVHPTQVASGVAGIRADVESGPLTRFFDRRLQDLLARLRVQTLHSSKGQTWAIMTAER